jgi:23S rRNA (uracil1939-C5)-methyltransferase
MKTTFHSIAAGGEGVGRDESGRTVFAAFAAPGDVAQVELLEEKKKFARGKIIRLETASPLRMTPPCPYYLPKDGDEKSACGGCQIQHLNYGSQREAKRALVQDSLERIGGVEIEVEECEPSPLEFGYRNKAEFFVGGDGAIGFHARRTHHVVDIARCPLVQEPINEALAALRETLLRDAARSVEVRADGGGKTAVRVNWREGATVDTKAFFTALRHRLPSLIDPNQQPLHEPVGDLQFRVGAFDFFQINSSLTPRLVEIAMQMAQAEKGTRALDVFCGSGLFGVALAKRGARVDGVDVRESMGSNARLNHLNVRVQRGDAAQYLRRAATKNAVYDVVLLDPPRAGAEKCLAPLLQIKPPRLVYVSCDPATLARDVKQLTEGGYQLRRVVPLDMFPQTAHVESAVLLEL